MTSTTVEDLCKKLRPVLGQKVENLWRAYLAEDAAGKREIEQILELLNAKTFDTNLAVEEKSSLLPPPEEKTRGDYPLGNIVYANKELHPFGLREHDWIKHTLIVGASGSGKTNLCFQILKNFIYKKKPFLVLDWKRNYRDILNEDYGKNVKVFTV